jgi:hypothetical protein
MNDGRKDDHGKPRLDLIPTEAIFEIGKVLGYGASKYGDKNWPLVEDGRKRFYGSALRHLVAWFGGEQLDKESGLNHLSHALTNIIFLLDLEKESPKYPASQEIVTVKSNWETIKGG